MLFNSIDFLWFGLLAFIGYWFVFNRTLKLQNGFLLVASYVFYGWWDWRFLSLIFFSSLVDFWVGQRLFNSKSPTGKKRLLWVSLGVNLGLLGTFKYFNFFMDSFRMMMLDFGVEVDAFTLSVILPVGISFYTFQTLSYSLDIYRGKLNPTQNLINFLTYVSFFPQLVAGPIERAVNLLPQIEGKRHFDYHQAVLGCRQILWGFFKKVVIADNCAVWVDKVFLGYGELSAIELAYGAVLFAFQIYGDFSGYSDIAIGVSRLFGIRLMTNFRTPYFSRDIAEFWRRWHISLSTWFRDYLYIPLGGSRGGLWMSIRNTIIIFVVSGFWHGANWTFIVWGMINAVLFLPYLISGRNRVNTDNIAQNAFFPSFKELLQLAFTFSITCVAWVYFRAENVAHANDYLMQVIAGDFLPGNTMLFRKYLAAMIGVLLVVDWLGRKRGVEHLPDALRSGVVRKMAYLTVFVLIIMYGAFEETAFIYFQF